MRFSEIFVVLNETVAEMLFQAIKAGHSGFVTAVANYDPGDDSTTGGKKNRREQMFPVLPSVVFPDSRSSTCPILYLLTDVKKTVYN